MKTTLTFRIRVDLATKAGYVHSPCRQGTSGLQGIRLQFDVVLCTIASKSVRRTITIDLYQPLIAVDSYAGIAVSPT